MAGKIIPPQGGSGTVKPRWVAEIEMLGGPVDGPRHLMRDYIATDGRILRVMILAPKLEPPVPQSLIDMIDRDFERIRAERMMEGHE